MKVDKSAYLIFFEEIKEAIHLSQYEALKKVNKELINLYWQIGKMIVERQAQYGWGKSIVETLADDLQKEYPGVRGYSSSNLWRMRNFYETYGANEKLAPVVREIGWSHNVVIMEKCKDDLERAFYMKMTKKYGWSKTILIHQIEGGTYEKFLLNQTNFDQALEEKYRHQAKLAVKDEYSFDFLEMSEDYKERDLELGLVRDLRRFLIELGGNYAFIGNQHRLKVGTEEFFIDLFALSSGVAMFGCNRIKNVKF